MAKYKNLKQQIKPEEEPRLLEYNQELITNFFDITGIDETKLQLSNIGAYSITDFKAAEIISNKIKSYMGKDITITDGTANMGGDTISFAKTFKHVNAFEIVPLHCEILKNNINVYGLTNIDLHCKNYVASYDSVKQDVIYMDPPWGGRDYKKLQTLDLYLDKINVADLVNKLLEHAKLIVIKVPKNFNIQNFINVVNIKEIDIVKLQKFYVIFVKNHIDHN